MFVGKITKIIVREVIDKIVVKEKRGNKNYLIKDKEAYITATPEIDGARGIPIYIQTFTDELQPVLHDIGGQIIGNDITPESAQMYARRLFPRVNRNGKWRNGSMCRKFYKK